MTSVSVLQLSVLVLVDAIPLDLELSKPQVLESDDGEKYFFNPNPDNNPVMTDEDDAALAGGGIEGEGVEAMVEDTDEIEEMAEDDMVPNSNRKSSCVSEWAAWSDESQCSFTGINYYV